MGTWLIGAYRDGGATHYAPDRWLNHTDALKALLTRAESRFKGIECYCDQGEHCACGGWISAPLAFIAGIRQTIADVAGWSAADIEEFTDDRFAFRLPVSSRTAIHWEVTRVL